MAKELTFEEIKGGILNKKFMPVYLLQGEEPYFIDQLTELLIEQVLDESERDFNQTLVYGSETDIATVIHAAKRYPMMSERQLVVVKEAQNLKKIEELVYYVQKPQPTTILVLNYKHGKLDGRKKLPGEINKIGIVFESKKLYENKVPAFITSYLREKQVTIEPRSAQILTDYLGTNLSKITNELDKLIISLPTGQRRITPELIESNIGISKDFNNYELQTALASKDVLKANRIIFYFGKNRKNNPFIMTLNVLYNFFSNLMICHFETNKTEARLMSVLGFRYNFQVQDYIKAIKTYNAFKTMEIISLIRDFDAKAKGVNNISSSESDLLKELIYKIMHS